MTVTVKMMVVATDPPFETKAFLRQSKLMGWRVPNSSHFRTGPTHIYIYISISIYIM